MDRDSLPQSPVASASVPFEPLDPHGYLHLQMRVIGQQSRALGKVESIQRDATTGQVTGLTVSHGKFRHSRTAVPVSQIKWVNQDSVVLEMTRDAFRRLPRVAGA